MARPYWTGPECEGGKLIGQFREELEIEAIVFRAASSKYTTLGEINRGEISMEDILMINALLDHQYAAETEAMRINK